MNLQQLTSLQEKRIELQTTRYRQLLTLASSGLALLVGLGPTVPTTGIGKYFLAGTWVFLGAGILSGAAATYLEVDRAKKLADQYREELQKYLLENGHSAGTSPIVANPSRIFVWSKSVMVVSLLLAVCCLVSYAVLKTLHA